MPVPRPSVLVPDVAASAAAIAGFFGGRPRRFDPCRASIARFILSRSAIRSATMCSVGMLGRYYHPACSSGNETCLVECKWKTSKRPIKKRVQYGRISPNQPHLWSDNSDPSRRPRIASGARLPGRPATSERSAGLSESSQLPRTGLGGAHPSRRNFGQRLGLHGRLIDSV